MLLTQDRTAPPVIQGADTFETEALAVIDNLYGAAVHLTRNSADAEDLVHDTYVNAYSADVER